MLQRLFEAVLMAFSGLTLWDVLDIVVVAVAVYGLLSFFRGTTAMSVVYGLGLLLVAVLVVSSLPQLAVLNWLLRNMLPSLFIAVLILFQPELRRTMERIGRVRGLLNRPLAIGDSAAALRVVDEVTRACRHLSERRRGALFILERDTGLQEYADTGVPVDAVVSAEVLATIFFPNSPLHDGAIVIRGDRVVAASCVLPLSTNAQDPDIGTRHRAALGITEETDALAVVVSEETGAISLADNGRLVRHLDENRLRKALMALYRPPGHEPFPLWPHPRHTPERP